MKLVSVSFYPTKISERFNAPNHIGDLESANATGKNAAFICGSIIKFDLQIENKQIIKVKFKTNGCGFLIAAAELISETIENIALVEFNKVALYDKAKRDLGEFPKNRGHCMQVCFDALQETFNDYRKSQLKEFVGEKALICTCFGVSEEEIETIIAKHSLKNVYEVSDMCNAGSGCGSCQPLIQEILDSSDTY
jgi:NifU-like protein